MLTYKEHYELSIKNYTSEDVSLDDLYNFTALEVQAGEKNDFVVFDQKYSDCIQKLSDLSNFFFSNAGKHCWFPKDVDREKDKILRAKNVWLPEVNELASFVIPQVENKLFKSNSIVDGVYWYRSVNKKSPEMGSFIWHYDNHCRERIKIMFYLNNVDEDSAPFTYLWNEKDKNGLPCPTSRIDYLNWAKKYTRLSDNFIEDKKSEGYEEKRFLGDAGSFAIFDNNIAHKATNPSPGNHRDVIVLMVRPYHKKLPNFVSKDWTGSNMHVDNFIDPKNFGVEIR
jgi:hypothetical protein